MSLLHEPSQEDKESEQKPPNQRKKTFLIPLLLGVIIGILLVIVALPALVDNGLIGNDANQSKDEPVHATKGKEQRPEQLQNLSVDVSTQITDIVEDVSDTVVGIRIFQKGQGSFWDNYEGIESIGSGVIYKKSDKHAYIVTNHHVIDGADEIEVVLSNDTRLKAEVVGSDLYSDLAVIRTEGKDIKKVIDIGSSSEIKVGEPAIAIGNPLDLMFAGTVTQGVISGKERTIPQDFDTNGVADWQSEVIQTDAAINPGNSGGALINISGQLIGINSMKINETAVEGIGFAIPIDTAIPIMEKLEQDGELTRPYLGIEAYSLEDLPSNEWENSLKLPKDVEHGVYLRWVESFSPADEAGLERFDVIVGMDDEPIHNILDIRKILFEEKEIGDTVEVLFYRGKEKNRIKIKLIEKE